MAESNQMLFAYGTLRDAEMRKALFKAVIPDVPATLQGFALKESGDYYFITEEAGHKVDGVLIGLSEAQILLADQWEEIPSYERIVSVPPTTFSSCRRISRYWWPERNRRHGRDENELDGSACGGTGVIAWAQRRSSTSQREAHPTEFQFDFSCGYHTPHPGFCPFLFAPPVRFCYSPDIIIATSRYNRDQAIRRKRKMSSH